MKLKILLVDDDVELADVLGQVIEYWGHSSTIVNSAEQALELLAEDPPFDVVLTDIRMPGMDGVQLVRRARPRTTSLRWLCMTGGRAPQLFLDAEDLGVPVLEKPFRSEVLRAHLEGRAAAPCP